MPSIIGWQPDPGALDGAEAWAQRSVTFSVGALAIELERLGVPRSRVTQTGTYQVSSAAANYLVGHWVRGGKARRSGSRQIRWVAAQ